MSILTSAQSKMARAGVDWTVKDLASAADVAPGTIVRLESGDDKIRTRTLRAIRAALEEAGVIFIDEDDECGAGARLRKPRGDATGGGAEE